MYKYGARGEEKLFANPSCFYNIPQKRQAAVISQSKARKEAWEQGVYKDCTGENHPNWRGGLWEYPAEFNDEFKDTIRKRDNRRCQNPKCPSYSIGRRRPLHIHHIDRDKSNLSPDNLITLCDNCHHRLHALQQDPPLTVDILIANC